ncbi:hypothetical protein QE152_g11102 [Popillia japonica]|uniref:VWFC domain-containing protein n=1 Tax=Popillia japonica TaxID=7064 RepID=A0AAW1LUA8_POPJA
MPRVLWFSVQLLCLLLDCPWWNRYVSADCWYNTARYREGQEVTTAEPCLNCTCSKATLVCYLRVCPKLPNPPPPGCILLYKYKACCPELICQDSPIASYYVEGRSETDDVDLLDRRYVDDACIVNGTIYAPGSAMDSSTFCEYCYCLGGKERCVKPKCLLPVEGCTPVYSANSCCPVHYNCNESHVRTSTTTISPQFLQDSCLVAGKIYRKGHKILGVGHSACDNCYCIRGLVRCEPLSCAPPLLGCLPVIKPGECCAASYNCSGAIETRPEPNYGNFPIVSKEYAKFRKEVTTNKRDHSQSTGNSIPTTKAHRISGYYGTTRHFAGNTLQRSTAKPYDKIRTTTIYPENVYRYEDETKAENEELEPIQSRINTKSGNEDEFSSEAVDSTSTTEFTTLEYTTTEVANQSNSTDNEVTMLASTIFDFFTQELFKDVSDEDLTTDSSTTTETTTLFNVDSITVKTVTNSTDCIEKVEADSQPNKIINNNNNTVEKIGSKNGNLSVEDDVTVVEK